MAAELTEASGGSCWRWRPRWQERAAVVSGRGGRGGWRRRTKLREVAGATAGQFLAVAAWVDGATGGGV